MSELLKGLRHFEKDVRLQKRIEILRLEWSRAFPHVDLKSQIQWAHAWIESNPRKAKKDYVRFLNNWMKGEERWIQERGPESLRAPDLPPPPKYDVPEDEVMTAGDFKRMKEALQ